MLTVTWRQPTNLLVYAFTWKWKPLKLIHSVIQHTVYVYLSEQKKNIQYISSNQLSDGVSKVLEYIFILRKQYDQLIMCKGAEASDDGTCERRLALFNPVAQSLAPLYWARQTCRPVRWPLTSRWYGTPFEQTNFNKLCLQDWFWLHWWLSCCIYFLAAGCMVPSNNHMLLPWHSQYSILVNSRLGCNNIHTLIIFNVPLLWLVLLNMLRIAQIPFIRTLEKRHYLNW
jgi:hypothetical protein